MADEYSTASQLNLGTSASQAHLAASAAAAAAANSSSPTPQATTTTTTTTKYLSQRDEMSQDLTYLAREAPLDGGESTLGGPAHTYSQLGLSASASDVIEHDNDNNERLVRQQREAQLQAQMRNVSPQELAAARDELALDKLAPDNVDPNAESRRRPPQQQG